MDSSACYSTMMAAIVIPTTFIFTVTISVSSSSPALSSSSFVNNALMDLAWHTAQARLPPPT